MYLSKGSNSIYSRELEIVWILKVCIKWIKNYYVLAQKVPLSHLWDIYKNYYFYILNLI